MSEATGAETEKPKPIKVESHGVTVEVRPERLADPRFTFCLARVADQTTSPEDKLVNYGRMLTLMLGDDGAYKAMTDLAESLDGDMSTGDFNEFFTDVLSQAKAKNS